MTRSTDPAEPLVPEAPPTKYPVVYLRTEPLTSWRIIKKVESYRYAGVWLAVDDGRRSPTGYRRIFVPFSAILFVDYGPIELIDAPKIGDAWE